jgi:hypothetical protein
LKRNFILIFFLNLEIFESFEIFRKFRNFLKFFNYFFFFFFFFFIILKFLENLEIFEFFGNFGNFDIFCILPRVPDYCASLRSRIPNYWFPVPSFPVQGILSISAMDLESKYCYFYHSWDFVP